MKPLGATKTSPRCDAPAMLLTPQERRKLNIEHAHWRVEFLLHLLDSHRALPGPRDESWRRREVEFQRSLAKAQVELEAAEGVAMAS
jgi:hypothetical protein